MKWILKVKCEKIQITTNSELFLMVWIFTYVWPSVEISFELDNTHGYKERNISINWIFGSLTIFLQFILQKILDYKMKC